MSESAAAALSAAAVTLANTAFVNDPAAPKMSPLAVRPPHAVGLCEGDACTDPHHEGE